MRLPALILILVLAPGLAVAQSLTLNILQALKSAPHITESEWRDITTNNTVIYEIEGQVFAYEQYLDNNTLFLARMDTQDCQHGTWFMREQAFCFDWEKERQVCFHHKRLGDDIYVIQLRDGMEINEFQRVTSIEPRPVYCELNLLSALTPLETGPFN